VTRYSQVVTLDRPSNLGRPRTMANMASCVASAASVSFPVIRRQICRIRS
jgi:hypothetical protein